MSRPTLKLKPAQPAAEPAAPKPLSSRARRARAANKVRPPTPAPYAPVVPVVTPSTRRDAAASPGSSSPPSADASGTRRRTRKQSGAAQRAARDARKEAAGEAPVRRAGSPRPAAPTSTRPHERRHGGGPPAAAPTSAPRPAPAPRRPDEPRLSKRMSEEGLCSRREADEWIENGWVRVDGQVVTTLGTRVSPHARITVDRAALNHQSERVTILLHKPIGYVSGQAEHGYEPASVLIRPENHWPDDPSRTTFKPQHLRGLAPAGRLDIDSTGLLVFTQDGRVARHLIGRDSGVEKEYLVRVQGALSAAGLAQLQHGLELDGVKLKPAKVSWQNADQLRFVLREGRKRQIRRMCELVGLVVTGLKRVRSGSVALGKLPLGQWRYLRPDETF